MRTRELFNENWRFLEGDAAPEKLPITKGPLYGMTKAESAQTGPAYKEYCDDNTWWVLKKVGSTENWMTVSLPHDYAVDQVPDRAINEGLGFLPTKNAWYRKTFRLEESDRNKRLTLYFEGVSCCCTVWVNSCLAKRNYCGYVPFEVDLTDYALYGEENVIAVYIDASHPEGWWYGGAGIYRNVWLQKTDLVSVDTYGVYVAPKKLDETKWEVPIETTVRNDDLTRHRVTVQNELLDESGAVIASAASSLTVEPMLRGTVKQTVTVTAPALWSCETPHLYYCRTSLFRGKTAVDETQVHFGFRTIHFDPDRGFFLNGQHTLIKGVCCHEDSGLEGRAVSPRVKRYRIKLLKEMGCNGYRTSHYCQSDDTLDELDRQGFLVMDETRWFGTCDEYIDQLLTLVKRDRNRPGVIMWSIFNEEPLAMSEIGRKFVGKEAAIVRQYDSTRPITCAVDADPRKVVCFDRLDLIGLNYNTDYYDMLHKKFPKIPIYSSENSSSGTTRGWYFDNCEKRAYITAYDHDFDDWFQARERTWKFLTDRPWVAGGFQWNGIEYRGEAGWPRLCSQSGAIDLFLQKKDAFYQNQSFWSEQPMIHILPHWNLAGREGETVPVWVYTNCPEAELFYNGESMGRKTIERYGHGEWQLIYAPGEVTAKGYIDGKEAAFDRVATTGAPVALKLSLMTEALFADPYDAALVTCYCVDAQGNPVPDAEPFVRFECNGPGYIRSTGSDVSDHAPLYKQERQMRAGAITVLVRAKGQEGTVTVYARAEGLKPTRLEIPVTRPNGLIR